MEITLKTEREKEILDNIIEIVKENVNPERIYIFGSRAKGTAFSYSDFDIGVDANIPDIIKLEKLKEKIDEISGLYSVDIVFMKDIENDFKDIIKKTGVIIYER